MKNRLRGAFAPKIVIPVIAAGAIGLGTVGILTLMSRKGEAAINMIPADAIFAMSFDNTPSAEQVPLFNEIKNAMEDSGLNQMIDDALRQLDPKNNSLEKIRNEIKGSFAVGVWGDVVGGAPDVMLAITLNNPTSAENLIAAWAQPKNDDGLRYYVSPEGEMILTFYKEYAIMASSVQAAKRAIATGDGKEQSLYAQPSFQAARDSLPSDASLMVFVNGAAIAEADPETKKMFSAMGVDASGWAAYGVSLRREGIQIDSYSPCTSRDSEFAEAVDAMTPLNYKSLERFPAGALGVAGISSPASVVEMIRSALDGIADAKSEIERGISEMEQKTGFSFAEDLLPAFRGELFMALYPGSQNEPGVIIGLDNSNGANVTEFAARVIEKINMGAFDEGDEKPRLQESQVGDLKVYRAVQQAEEGWLAIGQDQIFLVSKKDLLEAVANPQSKNLSNDEGVRSVTRGEPAQFKLSVDLERVLDEVLKAVDTKPEDVQMFRQCLAGRELTLSWSYDGKVGKMRMLIPIDIPQLIRTAGQKAREQQHPQQSGVKIAS